MRDFPAQLSGSEGPMRVQSAARFERLGATNQDGPGGSQLALQAVVPGPRRSARRTD